MTISDSDKSTNTITIDGVTFITGGNIVFSDTDEERYYLAQNSHLEKMEGFLEHGMQMLLKKIKP
ncbi:MAG: hypothetical protein PHH60_01330 [Candidatus Margulisbacteria bacterium]|nr:hypothetical protein [Candidatus Margulisiibacteriota bacterium]